MVRLTSEAMRTGRELSVIQVMSKHTKGHLKTAVLMAIVSNTSKIKMNAGVASHTEGTVWVGEIRKGTWNGKMTIYE